MSDCNDRDKADDGRRYLTRKGADFRQVLTAGTFWNAHIIGDVRQWTSVSLNRPVTSNGGSYQNRTDRSRLERLAGKPARAVLRGGGDGNVTSLPDYANS